MFDGKQKIILRWNNKNREWYESKGYTYTKWLDYFEVNAEDLMPHSAQKVKVICDYCGNEYETQYAVYTSGLEKCKKSACQFCAGKKISDTHKEFGADKYYNKAKKFCDEKGYKLLTTREEYTSIQMPVKYICPKHGLQTTTFERLTQGHECMQCSYEHRADSRKKDLDEIFAFAKKTGNVWLNPEEYKDVMTHNLKFQCQCGTVYETSCVNFMKHNVFRCPKCARSESVMELFIRKFLEKNDINFVPQKRFDDCRDKKPLPFDFYLPEYNLIIEFDGYHHYYPSRGEKHFEDTQKHDKMKNVYCDEHNIDLLRIPYWESKNVEKILTEKLAI